MFDFKIYNSLTKKKEKFFPIQGDNVKIYACGPTVYNYAHIGNARMAIVCDLLVRFLRANFSRVTYVSNITDIDDKIIVVANEKKLDIREITLKYEKIYNANMNDLGILKPDKQPRATEYISDMINLITKLIEKKHAYISNNHVIFDIETFPKYGMLSGRDVLEQMAGKRVEVASYKKNAGDFVLWKPSKIDQPGWNSPWGRGRPGWHIECSAMSEDTLGLPFDIHCGGLDLKFPHHENEIAQSCAAHSLDSARDYANYWVHNGFVNINGEKMSKSKGNIFLVNDLLKKYSGEAIRLALLSSHYRQPLNWNDSLLIQSNNILNKVYRALKDNREVLIENESLNYPPEPVMLALSDDLNFSKVLLEINSLTDNLNQKSSLNKESDKSKLLSIGKLLGFFDKDPDKWFKYGEVGEETSTKEIKKLIDDRNKARKNKDFKVADDIRIQLNKMGIEIEDTKDDTLWRHVN